MTRIEQLKDILDEWSRGRPDGSEISRVAIIRRARDSCSHAICVCVCVYMCVLCVLVWVLRGDRVTSLGS